MNERYNESSIAEITLCTYIDFQNASLCNEFYSQINYSFSLTQTAEKEYEFFTAKQIENLYDHIDEVEERKKKYEECYNQITDDNTLDEVCSNFINDYKSGMKKTQCINSNSDFYIVYEFKKSSNYNILSVEINGINAEYYFETYDYDNANKIADIIMNNGNSHSILEYDKNILTQIEPATSHKLNVQIPIVLIRIALLKHIKSSTSDTGSNTINCSLSVSINFRIDNPDAIDSNIYFMMTKYHIANTSKIRNVNHIITNYSPISKLSWIPTLQSKNDKKKKQKPKIALKLIFNAGKECFSNGILVEEEFNKNYDEFFSKFGYDLNIDREINLRSYIFNSSLNTICIFGGDYVQILNNMDTCMNDIVYILPKVYEETIIKNTLFLNKAYTKLCEWLGNPLQTKVENGDNKIDLDEKIPNYLTMAFIPIYTYKEKIYENKTYGSIDSLTELSPIFNSSINIVGPIIETPYCTILSLELLHNIEDNSDFVKWDKMTIVEALISMFIKYIEIDKLYSKSWFIACTKKFIRILMYKEIYGTVETLLLLDNIREAYCNLVERGFERQPLAVKAHTEPWQYIDFLSITSTLKTYLIFVSLNCLVVSTSKAKYFVTENYFMDYLFGSINKAKRSEWFFEKLADSIKEKFIEKGLHKTATMPPTERFNQAEFISNLPDQMSINDLNLNLYKGHQMYDIDEILNDIFEFKKAYIYGIGAANTICKINFSIHKRTGFLEELKLRAIQNALLPPSPLNNSISYFKTSLLSAGPFLDRLLSKINSTNNHLMSGSTRNKFLNVIRRILNHSNDALHVLNQLNYKTEIFKWDPAELIVKDNKHYYCFGYLGNTVAPVCGGKGQLYQTVVKHLNAYWQQLSHEERTILASDTSAMENIIANGCTPRIPMDSIAGTPQWLPNILCWYIIRQLQNFEFLPKSNLIINNNIIGKDYIKTLAWANSTKIYDNTAYSSELPISSNAQNVYPVVVSVKLLEDIQVTEHMLSIRGKTASFDKTLRDPAIPAVFNPAEICKKQRLLGLDNKLNDIISGVEAIKFIGKIFSNLDKLFINKYCNDTIRMQFIHPNKMTEANTDQSDIKSTRGLPILWYRLGEDSFIIGKFRKFQSFGMWMQQLSNESDILSQLEAIKALSEIFEDDSIVNLLFTITISVKYHPSIRTAAIDALVKGCMINTNYNTIIYRLLLNNLFILYIDPVLYSNSTLSNTKTPLNELANYITIANNVTIEFDKILNFVATIPTYTAGNMSVLRNILFNLSIFKLTNGQTPDDLLNIYLHFFTVFPSPLDIKIAASKASDENENISEYIEYQHFLGYLISLMPNISYFAAETSININEILQKVHKQLDTYNSRSNYVVPIKFMSKNTAVTYGMILDAVKNIIDEKFLKLYTLIITRIEIEQKMFIRQQYLTIEFLQILPYTHTLRMLYRLRNLVMLTNPDILHMYTPAIKILLPPIEKYIKYDDIIKTKDSYASLLKFRNLSISIAESIPSPWTEILFQLTLYTSHCIWYTNEKVHNAALKSVFLHILSGLLVPPSYMLDMDITSYTRKTLKNPNIFFQNSEQWKKQAEQFYEDVNNTFFGFNWIENTNTQKFIARSGLAVLYAIKFACCLDCFFLHNDNTHLIYTGWAVLHEALFESINKSPDTLIAYILTSERSFSLQSASLQMYKLSKTFSENAKEIKKDKSIKIQSNNNYSKAHDTNDKTILATNIAADILQIDYEKSNIDDYESNMNLNVSTEDINTNTSTMVKNGVYQYFKEAIDISEIKFPSVEVSTHLNDSKVGVDQNTNKADIYEDAKKNHQRAPNSTEKSNTPKFHRKKFKRIFEQLDDDDELLCSPVITCYEILFQFLHFQAPLHKSNYYILSYYVREIIIFLFGIGIPMSVIDASMSVDEVLKKFEQITVQNHGINDKVKLNIDKFLGSIQTQYYTLRPPTTDNANKFALSKLQLLQNGIICQPIMQYDKLHISFWNYTKKLEKWPLPIKYDWKISAKLIIQALKKHHAAHWFIQAVSAVDNPNYYKVIKNPICLNEIQEKLNADLYSDYSQWKNDLYTIFRNCRTYNQKGSIVTDDCESVQILCYQLLHFIERNINSQA